MQHLNEEHITAISNLVHEHEITYSHLADDLIDHICCDIETLMLQGMNYPQASKEIFEKIGLNGLKEIQEATIFYVKFNLLIMKKLMNVLAYSGLSIFICGLLFKFNHWPGGSFLVLISFLLLFLGYLPTALLSIKKENKTKLFSRQHLPYLVGFVTIIETGTSLLFTIFHWPGAQLLIVSNH
jgi:hypothetical protein